MYISADMSFLRRHVPTTKIQPRGVRAQFLFPKQGRTFNGCSFDFDGDNEFGMSDLEALSKRHFNEIRSLGDGHCFFRVLDRFMDTEKLYTQQELAHFKQTRELLSDQNVDRFPELCYLRRLCQKFCMKINIQKYGREQEPHEDAMEYASDSQAYGLLCARNLRGTSARGYADTPDYAACAIVLGIALCILQTNGKWQVFPDECTEKGFGTRPIMFAYNQGDIHFNSLEPNIYKMKQRKLQINNIARQMASKPTPKQACRIASYFFNGRVSMEQLDKDLQFLQKRFECSLDVAMEILYHRIPMTENIQHTIVRERRNMLAFSEETFVKLLTYGNVKTKAGFNTATDIISYLRDKMHYIRQRDNRTLGIDELAQMYLNGD